MPLPEPSLFQAMCTARDATGGSPTRLTIIEFENIVAKETFASAEYRAARKIGDKFAKFKILATEEVDR